MAFCLAAPVAAMVTLSFSLPLKQDLVRDHPLPLDICSKCQLVSS